MNEVRLDEKTHKQAVEEGHGNKSDESKLVLHKHAAVMMVTMNWYEEMKGEVISFNEVHRLLIERTVIDV